MVLVYDQNTIEPQSSMLKQKSSFLEGICEQNEPLSREGFDSRAVSMSKFELPPGEELSSQGSNSDIVTPQDVDVNEYNGCLE